jgi:Phosphotransferase enzyme family
LPTDEPEPDSEPGSQPEQTLAGGMANAGRVVRLGHTVRRPAGPHTPAVHALLTHLERVGFDGAPRLLGIDEQGRSIVSYLDGDVAMPPYPAWSGAADLLDSVAELQRRYHQAVAGFEPDPELSWNPLLAQPNPRPAIPLVLGHNDLCLENVVVRDGRAVGFIDFDMAAPVERAWDLAIALRHWVPVRADADLGERAGVDRVARWHRWLDVHEVDDAERARVVELTGQFLTQALRRMGERAAAGEPAYLAVWQAGYPQQNRGAQDWLAAHAAQLTD